MNTWRVCASLVLLVSVELWAATSSPQAAIRSSGETTLASRVGGVDIQVKLRTHEVAVGTPDKPVKLADSACTMSRIPCSVLDGMDITVGGEPLFVPRSVFADLADLGNAKLKFENGKYILVLLGGDASESYVVKIVFTRKRITY